MQTNVIFCEDVCSMQKNLAYIDSILPVFFPLVLLTFVFPFSPPPFLYCFISPSFLLHLD